MRLFSLARSKPISFGLFETGDKRLQAREAKETGSSTLKRNIYIVGEGSSAVPFGMTKRVAHYMSQGLIWRDA